MGPEESALPSHVNQKAFQLEGLRKFLREAESVDRQLDMVRFAAGIVSCEDYREQGGATCIRATASDGTVFRIYDLSNSIASSEKYDLKDYAMLKYDRQAYRIFVEPG